MKWSYLFYWMSQKHDTKTYTHWIKTALSNECIVVHFQRSRDPNIGHMTFPHLENVYVLRTEIDGNTIPKPIPTQLNLLFPMNTSPSISGSHMTQILVTWPVPLLENGFILRTKWDGEMIPKPVPHSRTCRFQWKYGVPHPVVTWPCTLFHIDITWSNGDL